MGNEKQALDVGGSDCEFRVRLFSAEEDNLCFWILLHLWKVHQCCINFIDRIKLDLHPTASE